MSWFADLEDLVASAVAVTGYGEDLAARHLAADGRIDPEESEAIRDHIQSALYEMLRNRESVWFG